MSPLQVVAAIIMFNAPVQNFVLGNVAVQIVFALLPFLGKRSIPRVEIECYVPMPKVQYTCSHVDGWLVLSGSHDPAVHLPQQAPYQPHLLGRLCEYCATVDKQMTLLP